MRRARPDQRGHFGVYGGRYVAETLVTALEEVERAYKEARTDRGFQEQFKGLLRDYSGRPTPLYLAKRFSEHLGGVRVYLKREDLNHTGSHKITNALGQCLLARWMGKKRVLAETGAGQHGVATATACALLGLGCRIFMGKQDMERQATNVTRMRLLGAEVVPVASGAATLKEAMSQAMREWVAQVRDSYYVLGSAAGPHPYPMMVRDLQSIIGKEAKRQILKKEGRLPDALVACVGGGSNSLGLFYPFLACKEVAMYGVEAGGKGLSSGQHGASLCAGSVGVLHGAKTYILQDPYGQVLEAHSIAPGLDYPGVGPEHSYLKSTGRVKYVCIKDEEAVDAFLALTRLEGIVPALESAHAVAWAAKLALAMGRGRSLIVNLSGRGDKDARAICSLNEESVAWEGSGENFRN